MIFKTLTNSTVRKASPVFQFADKAIWKEQFEGKFDDKDFAIKKFEEWNAEVIATVPAEQLLVFEASQGWEPLCNFLGKPVPDTPFPVTNKRELFKGKIDRFFKEGVLELE